MIISSSLKARQAYINKSKNIRQLVESQQADTHIQCLNSSIILAILRNYLPQLKTSTNLQSNILYHFANKQARLYTENVIPAQAGIQIDTRFHGYDRLK